MVGRIKTPWFVAGCIGFAAFFAIAVVVPIIRCSRDGGLPVLSIGHVACAIPYDLIKNPPTPEPVR